MRLAAIGDLHCKKASQGAFQSLFAAASAAADVLVLCGDLTDYGLAEEARILVKELAAVKSMPVVAVLGNHDYESNETDQVKSLLVDAGVHLLDGEACEIDGVGFGGAKGLGGGLSPSCTTRRSRRRWRVSHARSIRFSARVGSRSRSPAMP